MYKEPRLRRNGGIRRWVAAVEEERRVVYCESCQMWLNGPEQWQDHLISKKHKKHKKKLFQPEPEPDSKKIVIPTGTVIIIEQTAIYNDAVRMYMLSLHERAQLRSRL